MNNQSPKLYALSFHAFHSFGFDSTILGLYTRRELAQSAEDYLKQKWAGRFRSMDRFTITDHAADPSPDSLPPSPPD
ncbi:MAG: hypothetical protein ABSD29_24630 [Verrucomicrobiota bacterium]|jgi:hypothetical protein